MATVVNDRDVLIMGTAPRYTPPTDRGMFMTPSSAVFKVGADGLTAAPGSFTFTAKLLGMSGTVTWSSTGGISLAVSGNTATLNFASFSAVSGTITATITVDGQSYTATATVARVADGAAGNDGLKTGVARLYQWASVAPSAPSGTSTFTWATVTNGSYTGSDGWNVAVPANPGTPGMRLYVASIPVSAAAATTTSPVSYINATVEAWSQNGGNGANGLQSATATVYQWAATIPAAPIGAASYTWATRAFGAAPSGWSLTPGTSPSAGMTLWAASVQLTDSAANSTTGFNWSSASVIAVGYAGTNGGPGQQGASYVTAYCASATGSATSAPAQTTGKTSLPATNSGGITGTWSTSVPTLTAGQYLYQSDGIYDPTIDKVTWSTPYWSSLKVATLSAITANLGAINAGSINLGGGTFTVDTDGNLVCRSIKIVNPDGSVMLQAGGQLNPANAAPGTLNSDLTPAISSAAQTAVWSSVSDRPQDAQNLVVRTLFDDGSSGNWKDGSAGSLSVVSVTGQSFSKALQINSRDNYEYLNRFPVVPGETLYVEAWLDASTCNSNIGFGVRVDNATGATINWFYGVGLGQGVGWTRVTGSITIPVGAATALPWFQINNTTNFGTARGTGFRVSRFQSGATVGAVAGANLKDSGGTVLGDSAIKNSVITIAPNGTLSGAGGGQVTLPGMGQNTYRVITCGNSIGVALPSTLGFYINGTLQSGTGIARSHNVIVLNRSSGAMVSSTNYDVFGSGQTNGLKASDMAAALNALGSDKVVVVVSYDEPKSNRFDSGLDVAMYRCGASRAVYGSANFMYRSAYVLIGIPGCGEGNGAEAYQGAIDSDPNAWVDVSFSLLNGSLIGVTANYTPRSLQDYGYYGDLNATSDLALVGRGVTVSGNYAVKTQNTANWDADVYSRDSFTGGAYASAVAVDTGSHLMFGLNSDPASDGSYASIDYALYFDTSTNPIQVRVYESGNFRTNCGVWVAGDVFAVIYDGSSVRYLKNGTVVYTSSTASASVPNQRLFFDSSFFYYGSRLSNIRFGPLSSNNWANVGGTGKPADYATVGAPSGTYVAGVPADTVATVANAVNDSTTGLSARMRNNTVNVLSGGAGFTAGTLTYDSTSGNRNDGYGVVMNKNGIAAYNSGGTNTFSIDATTGNASFSGALSAATGTFAGSLSAATGTFAGSLSAASGSFAGSLSAVTGSFYTLTIASGGYLRSANFSSGNSGFSFNADGSAELGVMSIRGAPTGPVSNTFNPCITTETTLVTLASGTGLTGAHKVVITVTGEIHSQSGQPGACFMTLYRGTAAGSETTQVAQWTAYASTPNGSLWNSTTTYVSTTYEFSVAADSNRTGAGVYFKVTAYVGSNGNVTTSSYATVTISTNVKSSTL